MLQPNFQFAGRYNLLTLLGRGGFSEVWLAEDLMAKVQVALKVYSTGQDLDDEGIEMFRKEFALVSDMNHTNLLRPTFYGYWDRMPFLVLPYCESGSLEKYVNSNRAVSEAEAWRILHDVASGLAYLHNHKPPVVHQDIKPGNILIGKNGKEECYMITDFGISAKMRNTIGADRKAFSSGTIAYMGPERFGPDAASVKASDIWSLGATMCELMTGDVPFGESGGQAQSAGVTMMDIPVSYSKQLNHIIKKCLDTRPWKRPDAQSIAEIAEYHVTGKKKFRTLYRTLIASLIVAGVIIGGLVVFNGIREKKRVEQEKVTIARNDSLSNRTIDKALFYISEGDSLLATSFDKLFEESYMNAFTEIKSIDNNFEDKVSDAVKDRAEAVSGIALSRIASAKDTLQRKSTEIKAMQEGNNNPVVREVYNNIAKRLDERTSKIGYFIENN